jgi:hypothetical protein
LTESDESDDEFDDAWYSLIDGRVQCSLYRPLSWVGSGYAGFAIWAVFQIPTW